MDRLIVKGLGVADGEYDFDLVDLANIGTPRSLTTREQHKVKVDAGVLPADLVDAVRGLDAAVMVSLAGIVIARHGRHVNAERLWDARFVYGFGGQAPDISEEKAAVAFMIADRESEQQEEVEEGPPAEASPSSPSGGSSSESTSESPGSGQSPTGLHVLPKSAVSGRETLAI